MRVADPIGGVSTSLLSRNSGTADAKAAAKAEAKAEARTKALETALVLPEEDRQRLKQLRETGKTVSRELQEAADKAKSARRDGLKQELTRLLDQAAQIAKIGDAKAAAELAEEVGRRIAKIAKQLAEAERALPAGERSAATVVPAAPAAAAPAPAAAPSKAEAANGQGKENAADPAAAAKAQGGADRPQAPVTGVAPAPTPTAASSERKPETTAVGAGPRPRDGETKAGTAVEAKAGTEAGGKSDTTIVYDDEEQEAAGGIAPPKRKGPADREGTVALLKKAAGVLDELKKLIDKARTVADVLDPEGSEKRKKASKDLQEEANDLRGLSSAAVGPPLDLTT